MTPFPGRRAIVFSLMTVLLATFFILLFWSGSTPKLDTTSSAVATRVAVMDQYISSWDAYVRDATVVSARGALLGMTQWISNNYLTAPVGTMAGMENNISSCILTGNMSLGGSPNFCFSSVNNSLTAKLNAYAALAQQELNINTTYQLDPNITVVDWAPFELRLSFGINYTVQDASGTPFSRWNRTQRYDIIVNVEGLSDPLFARYGVKTGMMKPGFTQRNITKYPVPRDLLTIANVSDLIGQRMYVEDRGMAPTYLERLAGNLSGPFDAANSSGIETLLRPNETQVNLAQYGLNTSFTDVQVFAGLKYPGPCAANATTFRLNVSAAVFNVSGFYLDNQHWARYNVNASQYNYTDSCS